MRTTFNIIPILEYANRQLLRRDEFATESFKSGICTMIETILFQSGAYSGYSYLNESPVMPSEEYNRYYYTPPQLR